MVAKLGFLLCLAALLSDAGHAAIVYPKAPDGGPQMINENVGRLLREDPSLLGGVHTGELTITPPFKEYFADPTNLLSGHLLSTAQFTVWRYLLVRSTNAIAAAVLMANPETGKAQEFLGLFPNDLSSEALQASIESRRIEGNLNHGIISNQMFEVIRRAEQSAQVRSGNFELRRLDVPAFLFAAVWLHSPSKDIIIPLPDAFGRWKSYQPYSEAEIIQRLRMEIRSTRTYHLNMKTFWPNFEKRTHLQNMLDQAESDSKGWGFNSTVIVHRALRKYLAQAGVDLQPPSVIFLNDRLGLVMIKGTPQEQNAAVPLLNDLNGEPVDGDKQ